jgi:hypothetical protein
MTHWKRSTSLNFILIHNEMNSFVVLQFITENMSKNCYDYDEAFYGNDEKLEYFVHICIVLDLRRWN